MVEKVHGGYGETWVGAEEDDEVWWVVLQWCKTKSMFVVVCTTKNKGISVHYFKGIFVPQF